MSAIGDFRGDYGELAAVMEASWGTNGNVPFRYTPEFLADCFRYPGSSFSLAPAVYQDSALAAFAAGFPRRVRIGGQVRRVLVVAFLTAAAEHRNSGYGIVVWSELMKRAASAGFDGAVNYCVEGDPMNRMIEGSCRRLGLPAARVGSFPYLSRLIWPKRAAALQAGPQAQPAALVTAAAELVEVALARVWSAEEAAWQLNRQGAVSAVAGSNAAPAVLTGYVMPIADRNRTPCLIVEDTLWGRVPAAEREQLVRRLLAKAAAVGARVAILPQRGYADVRPFLDCGFRPSQKLIHAYLSLWNGHTPDAPWSGYYLDVF